jgi:hypothetical protein
MSARVSQAVDVAQMPVRRRQHTTPVIEIRTRLTPNRAGGSPELATLVAKRSPLFACMRRPSDGEMLAGACCAAGVTAVAEPERSSMRRHGDSERVITRPTVAARARAAIRSGARLRELRKHVLDAQGCSHQLASHTGIAAPARAVRVCEVSFARLRDPEAGRMDAHSVREVSRALEPARGGTRIAIALDTPGSLPITGRAPAVGWVGSGAKTTSFSDPEPTSFDFRLVGRTG